MSSVNLFRYVAEIDDKQLMMECQFWNLGLVKGERLKRDGKVLVRRYIQRNLDVESPWSRR